MVAVDEQETPCAQRLLSVIWTVSVPLVVG